MDFSRKLKLLTPNQLFDIVEILKNEAKNAINDISPDKFQLSVTDMNQELFLKLKEFSFYYSEKLILS